MEILILAGLFVFAYILGSIPSGLILTRLFVSVDIRQKGSKSIGATNVRRIAGSTLGALTLAGDMLKGALPVYLASKMIGSNQLWGEVYISFVVLSAISGHLYPIFTKLRGGGKGVATAAGCFIILSPVACLIAILTFIMSACWHNHVSSGSLAAAAILPVAVWVTTNSMVMTGCAVVVGILICFRHMDNIKRLLSGTEPVIWKKRK